MEVNHRDYVNPGKDGKPFLNFDYITASPFEIYFKCKGDRIKVKLTENGANDVIGYM
jgi:hypothetical protein